MQCSFIFSEVLFLLFLLYSIPYGKKDSELHLAVKTFHSNQFEIKLHYQGVMM